MHFWPPVKVFNFAAVHFVRANIAVEQLADVKTVFYREYQEGIDEIVLTNVVLILQQCVD